MSEKKGRRFILRLPESLYESLKERSKEEHVSINQLCIYLLTYALGHAHIYSWKKCTECGGEGFIQGEECELCGGSGMFLVEKPRKPPE